MKKLREVDDVVRRRRKGEGDVIIIGVDGRGRQCHFYPENTHTNTKEEINFEPHLREVKVNSMSKSE